MAFSVRGLTRGVMGGITAYRRGALAGNEQNREIAAAEQARQRQAKQDELAALYQQIEANLASRRQAAQESQFKEEAPVREALAQQRQASAVKALREPVPKTRLISTAGGQTIVKDVPGQEFEPRPRGVGGGGGGMSAEQRQYQQIVAEARARLGRHDARIRTDRTYRRANQGRVRDENTEINAVIEDRFRRGELTNAERARLLGGAPVSPYGPRP